MLRNTGILASCAVLLGSVWSLPAAAQNAAPGLFFDEGDRAAIVTRSTALPWLVQARTEIIRRADEYMQTPLAPYPLTGPQNDKGTAGRALQNRLGALGFAGYLTGDERYTQQGRAMLLAVVRQTEPDNHDHWRGHLQQADAAHALAMGYDWMYAVMTPEERAEVRAELEAIGTVLYESDTTWGAPAPGVASCNHNSVHFGALGLVALALGDKPEWLAAATERVRLYFEHFADDTGYATEGHHYVGYGLGGAVPFSMALARHGGPDLLAEAEAQHALGLVGDQMVWKLLPFEGRMLALNDNFERPGEVAALAATLRAGRGDQLWAFLESLERSGSVDELGGYFGITYTSPFLFLWGDQPLEPVDPVTAGLPLGHHFQSGRVMLRSSWEGEDAAHVSFTSGYDFHRGHDHQDENSVTFYANGEGFLIDPQYWLERSDAHTTITVEGAEQIKGGDGRIVEYREDERGAMVRGQAEEAYDFDAAFIGQADRKLYFVRSPRPYIVFRDDLRTENGGDTSFLSRYITYPGNRIEQHGDAVIIHGERTGGTALMAVFSGTEPIRVSEDDVSNRVLNRRGTDFAFADYLRRITAEFVDESPELISFVIPFDGEEIPQIEITRGPERHSFIASVTFSDGTQDRFFVGEETITLQ